MKPVIDPQTVDTTSVPDDALPELLPELPPFPGYLITVRTAPPRPRAITSPSAVVGTEAEKMEAPMIAPQLTPQESAVAQQ
ncbi:MAG: hypothetical protein DMG56_12005 [Acidobacteria bacterium]|nr:MAG: hypothetical protein DMG56_12005 [Acidobacteriota bacterium]